MIHSATIVKGKLVAVDRDTDPPAMLIQDVELTYRVPSSRMLLDCLQIDAKIGQTIIASATLNADNVMIDTMTVLFEPEK